MLVVPDTSAQDNTQPNRATPIGALLGLAGAVTTDVLPVLRHTLLHLGRSQVSTGLGALHSGVL